MLQIQISDKHQVFSTEPCKVCEKVFLVSFSFSIDASICMNADITVQINYLKSKQIFKCF